MLRAMTWVVCTSLRSLKSIRNWVMASSLASIVAASARNPLAFLASQFSLLRWLRRSPHILADRRTPSDVRQRLEETYSRLDPIRLLADIRTGQQCLADIADGSPAIAEQ